MFWQSTDICLDDVFFQNETGYNVIAMLPGAHIGHEDDKITVIAANYDTLPSTGGGFNCFE